MTQTYDTNSALRVIRYRGRDVSYIDAGRGAPVVLLPPGASSGRAWRGVLSRLGLDWRTLAIHPSGYEQTETYVGPSALSLDDEARAVLRIMDETHVSRAHLVGHSYGGAIALRMVLTWPERFESLFLVEPAAYPLLEQAGEDALAREVESVNRDYIEQVRRGETTRALEAYIDYYNGSCGAWGQLPAKSKARLEALAPTIASALAAAHGAPTTLTQCAAIEVPTKLVHGAKTDPVHRRVAEIVARAVPRADLISVVEAGHMVTLTHPQSIAELLLAHLGEAGVDVTHDA